MFSQLGESLQNSIGKLKGQTRLTSDNISTTVREVRLALLEADVSLPIVKEIVAEVKAKAIGFQLEPGMNAAQGFLKIVQTHLQELMGNANDGLDLAQTPPAVVLLAGLQGAGKTTTAAKLARRLKTVERKKVMLASVDIHRPAAIEQLRVLAETIEVKFFQAPAETPAREIAIRALKAAKDAVVDVLIIDTAGRLHVDADMMQEISDIDAAVNPIETLFVADAMIGQDAVNSAKAFDQTLALTGVILTKVDGDARGGAALSVRAVTGKPIKFIGMGEKIDQLEPFHPDRVASRILGMGDMLSLIEQAEQKIDKNKAEKLAKKIRKGSGFDLEDYRDQIAQMNQMGGLQSMMDKLPGMGQMQLPQNALGNVTGDLGKSIAIINSMTPQERRFPAVIKGGRKKRIATGSGTTIQEVNKTLKQFAQMQKMMRKVGGKGKMARQMKALMSKGGMPPGGPPF